MQESKRGGKVLVTEDNPLHMKIFKLNLAVVGCDVTEAANGAEGLRLARECQPDLILADLTLPKLDGAEMIRALAADAATRDIPIIVVSARNHDEEVLRPMVAAFVRKPFDPEALTQLVVQTISEHAG